MYNGFNFFRPNNAREFASFLWEHGSRIAAVLKKHRTKPIGPAIEHIPEKSEYPTIEDWRQSLEDRVSQQLARAALRTHAEPARDNPELDNEAVEDGLNKTVEVDLTHLNKYQQKAVRLAENVVIFSSERGEYYGMLEHARKQADSEVPRKIEKRLRALYDVPVLPPNELEPITDKWVS